MPTFSELAQAAYCLRKLHHRRADGWERTHAGSTPDRLSHRYDELLAGSVPSEILNLDPETVAANLKRTRETFGAIWPSLRSPAETGVFLRGRACRGFANKIVDTDPPIPTFASSGQPPSAGVWRSHAVRAVAIGRALAWERDRSPERVLVEYPGHGIVRAVQLSERRRETYRRVLRAVDLMGTEPSRTENLSKCHTCEYEERCGPGSSSLLS